MNSYPELDTRHQDQLSAASLDTDRSKQELEEAHQAEIQQLIQKHQTHLDTLDKDREAKHQELESYREAAGKALADITLLRVEIDSLTDQHRQDEEKEKLSQQELVSLRSEINRLNSELGSDAESKSKEIELLQSDIDRLTLQLEEERQKSGVEPEVSSLTTENVPSQQSDISDTDAAASLQQELSGLRQSQKRYKDQIDGCEQEIEQLREQLEESERDRDRQKERVSQLQELLQATETQLLEEKATADQRLADTRQQQRDREEENQTLNLQVEELRTQVDQDRQVCGGGGHTEPAARGFEDTAQLEQIFFWGGGGPLYVQLPLAYWVMYVYSLCRKLQ